MILTGLLPVIEVKEFSKYIFQMKKGSWEPLLKGIPQRSGLSPIIFNIFNNDIFHFIEKCYFINYAYDDTLSKVSSSIDALMEALKHDSKIAIESLQQSFMEANIYANGIIYK